MLAEKALLHWGKQRMKLETVTAALEGLGAFQHMESVFPSISTAFDSLCFITVQRMKRRSFITDGRASTIVALLDGARGQKATDPRDKVYALLGLAPNPMHKQVKEHDVTPLWREYRLQTYFTDKGRINYFFVTDNEEKRGVSARASDSVLLTRPEHQLFEKLKKDRKDVKRDLEEQASVSVHAGLYQ